MLSILIPIYNCEITSMVNELHLQACKRKINFEILAYDDASKPEIAEKNKSIASLTHTTYKILNKNIGRSAIRNLLAQKAKYNLLLFIDAGTFPKNKNFIRDYLKQKNKNVVCGGMTHHENFPDKRYILRWLYTKKREVNTLCSSNFLIKKKIMQRFPFDESLNQYGYEDVLFFKTLTENSNEPYNIKNEVVHISDDDAETFIKKTECAIENLKKLEENNKLSAESSKILKYHHALKKWKLANAFSALFKILKQPILKNLKSSSPSLLLFDIYRLGYFCTLKQKQ